MKMNNKKITLIALNCIINFAYGASSSTLTQTNKPRNGLKDLQYDLRDAQRSLAPTTQQLDDKTLKKIQEEGEKRAANRLIRSFKGKTISTPGMIMQEKPDNAASSINKIRILPSEQNTFDQMKAYSLALDYNIPIDPVEAFRICVKVGPDRASTLLKGIIKHYPKYRTEILGYLLRSDLHNQNYAFPFNPILKPINSNATMPLIKYIADLGDVSARAAYKVHCLKEKKAEKELQRRKTQEQAQKNADFWAEKKKQREEVARKQQELKKLQTQQKKQELQKQFFVRACNLINEKKYNQAKQLLNQCSQNSEVKVKQKELAKLQAQEKKRRELAQQKKRQQENELEQQKQFFVRACNLINEKKYNQAQQLLNQCSQNSEVKVKQKKLAELQAQEKKRRELEQQKKRQQKKERAIQAAKKRKQREESARKQQEIARTKQKEQDEQNFKRAKAYIKQAKHNQADAILGKLADKGFRKAIVEQGKIHQELMYKAMATQATTQHTKSKMNTTNRYQKQKTSLANSMEHHKESALKRFESAGAYGHYYTAKFLKNFAQFYEDTHRTLAETALGQARSIKQTSIQQRLIDAGKKKRDAAIAMWHNSPNIYSMQAAKKLEQEAVAHYKLAVQKGDSRGWTHIGILHEQLHDVKGNTCKVQAITALKKVKENDPNYAKALTHLACLHAGKGLYKEGIELLKAACKHDPKYRKSYDTLANLCNLMFKRPAPPVDTIEDHVHFMETHGGETAQTHCLLGKCAMMRNEDTQAIKHFVKAGQRGLSDGWYHAGIITLKTKNPKDAKAYFKSACDLNGCNTKALIELGNIYSNEGNDLKAQQYYAAAAGLGDNTAHHKLAMCLINGEGGIYNSKLGASHHEQSLKNNLVFGERRKREILTQLFKLQSPSCEDDVPAKEAKAIQEMILLLIKEPIESIKQKLKINTNDAKKMKAEAFCAQANLHRICAQRMQKSIGTINLCGFSVQEANQEVAQEKTRINQLKTEFVKNKDAIASCIQRIKKLGDQISVITNRRQEIMYSKDALKLDPTNARFTYNVASRLQCLFPKKKLSEMTQSQKQECSITHGFYLRVIEGYAKNKPDSFFVYNARCNLGKMLKHLYPDDYKDKIIKIFTMGAQDKVRRNINIAHAYETGLLDDNGKPDYQSAAKHIAQALKLKPKKQYLRKEFAFYTYASNPSALSNLELAFILELNKKLNGKPCASTLGQRLQAYNRIDMGSTDIISSQGYDANGKPTITIQSCTKEQQYASSSSNSKN